ncbi:MAG: hypothetical protein KGQ75_17165 [Sphingomonadales bacterium]|uniref:hypothetical protein n=1 Tax=Novosphingobium sp. AAP93 TaxID=1523427 RepID=UPI0006B88FA3|nr:hypothetical protein [Novosphingobium sp. AAP93]KPF89253.1 hypothetical protein IP83_03030 [Novosphingobium sp. AAP93]MBU6396302.1 hypothetical protein [Sphingomonadales bacterium]
MLTRLVIAAAALALVPAAVMAGHSELDVPPADTFLLGGEQKSDMVVSGRNTGQTTVAVLSATDGSSPEVLIATVAPGASFKHAYGPGEIAMIRNKSTSETAHLSVDFTGSPSSLSMAYLLPQKD